tara:strand:+ start:1166 stop:2815 length:1650 start_codon:yes stop_codon:yes gene_type:complete
MNKTFSIVFSTRKIDQYYIELLKTTSGVKDVEVIAFENSDGQSLTKLYNEGLIKTKNDIVLFCHDDLKFDTRNWGRKLLNHFKRSSEYGIIGVAGTRYLASTGRWWEDFSKMHGAVYHEDNGKRWLTRYSKDIGNGLDDVVLVDGLFFAVNKKLLKNKFNREVEGFHFYDVDFCFSNYLEGVKIGVCTDIKLTHLSIGKTNDEWEENRKVFAEKHKENLPTRIKKVLRKNEKLNILIGCLNFNDFTGSELHVYELAKGLKKEGHNVTICSNVGGEMEKKAKILGINTYGPQEPPGFKVGDDKTQVTGPDGKPLIMKKGQLYKVSEPNFDIMHLHHKPITEHFLRLFPTTPVVCTIHSEVIDLEHPVKDDRIVQYICIRPEIQEFIVSTFDIDKDKTTVIYNPFDTTRFKKYPFPKSEKKRVLFVGTIDYLRQDSIIDLVNETEKNNEELWIVGRKRTELINNLNKEHVKYFEPTWNVENYIKQVHKTAGILLGRTTIEGWLCGRPGIIYDINQSGEISSKNLYEPPNDINKFSSKIIIDEIIKTYELAL